MFQEEILPAKIVQSIQKDLMRLEMKTDELVGLATKRANAERLYKIKTTESILHLKDEGYAATIIPKLTEGNVAQFKFDMDVADAVYKACLESIRNLRVSIDAGRSILSQKKEEMKG